MTVDLKAAVRCLAEGRVLAYPTETVWGLGVDARSRQALEDLYRLKGRKPAQPLSVLVPDLAGLERWVPDLSPAARRLCRRFWPGPLTLVLPVPAGCLTLVSGHLGVGFRCSAHPTALALVRASASPLVSTSCNRSGAAPCRDIAEVEQVFGRELPVLSGESPAGGAASTVVTLETDGRIQLLREGVIPLVQLEKEIAA